MKLLLTLGMISFLTLPYPTTFLYMTCNCSNLIVYVCRGGWTISGLDLDHPNLLAIAEAERQILELEYDDYTEPDTTLAAFFRISALIVRPIKLLAKFQHYRFLTDEL